MLALAITILLLGLILLRVPISFAIIFSGLVGLIIHGGWELTFGAVQTLPQSAISKNALAAIPLFILMAQFVLKSGYLKDLFDAAQVIIGRIRGGTAFAAIGAGAIFASVSGSSTASAATLAHTSAQQLIDQGYSARLSSGSVAAAGTLAAMIPPSVLLVFYAITADLPVGQTLVAGFVPGTLVAVALCLAVVVTMLMQNKSAPPGVRSTFPEKIRASLHVLPLFFLFLLVIGLVFFGITTATEAAGVGAVGAFLLMGVRRQINWKNVSDSFKEALSSTTMILSIIFAAHIFSHFIIETRTTNKIVDTLSGLPVAPLVVVGFIAIGYLILGFFMDQMAIIALTVPVTLPVVTALGFDPIWFGVVVILMAEIGLITPPLGLNVFVVARSVRIRVEEVFVGAAPFALAILLVATLLFFVPDMVMFLPNFMASS
ncbi:TRAP transporter large permease [uncultured Corynebacterium sp.]|uniref:TRAP transporter large permease n=1 Tax=uncultured Corynebacterium sp. TaxID=159447 RepID=UPI0025CD5474|nr:TRAP transporter large permease [uncultured Corynebacterium sp.]